MTHLLNTITLHVKVPVLSENIYSTYPNSSFIVVVKTFGQIFFSSQYIASSLMMKYPYKTLTISSETMSEMGIIEL
jgi:hypothetical protein